MRAASLYGGLPLSRLGSSSPPYFTNKKYGSKARKSTIKSTQDEQRHFTQQQAGNTKSPTPTTTSRTTQRNRNNEMAHLGLGSLFVARYSPAATTKTASPPPPEGGVDGEPATRRRPSCRGAQQDRRRADRGCCKSGGEEEGGQEGSPYCCASLPHSFPPWTSVKL